CFRLAVMYPNMDFPFSRFYPSGPRRTGPRGRGLAYFLELPTAFVAADHHPALAPGHPQMGVTVGALKIEIHIPFLPLPLLERKFPAQACRGLEILPIFLLAPEDVPGKQ